MVYERRGSVDADIQVEMFGQMLTKALPEHTHRSAALFGPTSWTWSTAAGVWSVTGPAVFASGWHVAGPGGKWTLARDRVLPVLRALGAIPDTEQGG